MEPTSGKKFLNSYRYIICTPSYDTNSRNYQIKNIPELFNQSNKTKLYAEYQKYVNLQRNSMSTLHVLD